MTADAESPEGLSLKRWSRRKLEATRERNGTAAPAGSGATPAAGAPSALPEAAPAAAAPLSVEALPPVESLTIDSDFVPFLQPKVDETLKRQALKQLFRDPHFNVMDGLDVYIDDYSIPDPISPDVVRQMVQGRYIFDPPATRVNAQGHVEDVPPEEAALAPPVDPAADALGSPPPPATAASAAEPVSTAPSESAVDPASAPGTPERPAR